MNKKITTLTIFGLSIFMIVSWAVIFFMGVREQQINYWWQVGLAVCPIVFGVFGLLTAKKWSWLKSGVGQSVFFISLGLIVWGIGQAGWTYFLFKYPGQESPPSHLLDIIDFSTIPIWIYGVIKLSRAAGARYGFKKLSGKLIAIILPLVMAAVSYYFLVIIARGGSAYFAQPFWKAFFDLGYAIGDVIILTIALVIFGLSWKFLGGRFRRPITLIIVGFGLLYLADFAFSYSDGKGQYYNGNYADLLFILMVATLGIALNLFSPARIKQVNTAESMYDPANSQSAPPIPVASPQIDNINQIPTPNTQITAAQPANTEVPNPPVSEPAPDLTETKMAPETGIHNPISEPITPAPAINAAQPPVATTFANPSTEAVQAPVLGQVINPTETPLGDNINQKGIL